MSLQVMALIVAKKTNLRCYICAPEQYVQAKGMHRGICNEFL